MVSKAECISLNKIKKQKAVVIQYNFRNLIKG